MPTYEYACKSCGEHLEVVQSFKDPSLTTCPACQGQLRKVFGSIGISFKGSGFYKTDSRSSSAASASAKPSESKPSESKSESKSSSESTTSKSDSSGSGSTSSSPSSSSSGAKAS